MIFDYFSISKPLSTQLKGDDIKKTYSRLRWQVIFATIFGYGLFIVCRLSINVIKKPIVDAGILNESELGIIGTGLFVTYAVGKFANGFLADRSNVKRFLAVGLLISALINLALGFTTSFAVFVVLWAINGWAQSMGAAPCVVSLSRWFGNKERGTYYGLWSSSHNIGETLTFIATAAIVSAFGWQWGFKGAAILGLLGVVIIILFMHDTPQSNGLPPIAVYKGDEVVVKDATDKDEIARMQKAVLRNPAIWTLALASAFMYICRYAVNSWGIFYLEAQRGYDTLEASSIISISSICGVIGTIASGWVSDKFFGGKRYLPAVVFGVMNIIGLTMFLFMPATSMVIEAISMIIFGLAIGALLCFLGGLMATDIASKKASGAALGVVGIASYAGAALQDFVSGLTIESNKVIVDGTAVYDFSVISWFWLGAAILSVIFTIIVWILQVNKKTVS
ncbi:MAG: MFS transporter [Prevotella sp.]